MAHFEVFIPAQEEAGFDLTLRVEADNWIAALKTGMGKIGLQGPGGNIFCDIKDDSIHVTDPTSKKVFRIRELGDEASGAAEAPAPSEAPAAAPPASEAPAVAAPPPASAESAPITEPGMPAVTDPAPPPAEPEPPAPPPAAAPSPPEPAPPVSADPAPAPAPDPAPAPAPPPPVAPAPARPSPTRETEPQSVVEVARTPTRPPETREVIGRAPEQVDIEEVLADLFMRVEEVFSFEGRERAMGFILDLAMEKVPCESGSIYRADISTRDMFFAAARGPKADELLAMNLRIPVGTGLAGFTVEEGVALAISDAHRDPRFFKTISEKLGYECRSIITVPMQIEGQVMGAVQLINRKDGTAFGEADLSVLNYLAHEASEYLRRTGDVTV